MDSISWIVLASDITGLSRFEVGPMTLALPSNRVSGGRQEFHKRAMPG